MSPSKPKKVFIIGPGFIGWNVLDLLVREKKYEVTGLVRREEHADSIRVSGATPIMGTLDDSELITQKTSESDIVIHTATADHKPSVLAVLEGIRVKIDNRGKDNDIDDGGIIFIHTSGTSVLDDGSNGNFKGEQIYHDDRRHEIDSVPNDAPHRQIDLAIVKAQKEIGRKAKLAIMIPPLIYGFNPDHGRLSIQIPTLTRFALKHGFAGHVGAGLSVESQIHVLDLARAYITLLHHMEKSDPAEFLENPYFFCEDGHEFSWLEVAQHIGQELHGKEMIKDPTPRQIPEELWQDLFGTEFTPAVVGLNSRSRAIRLRKLGWEPKEKSIWESYAQDELPVLLTKVEKEGGLSQFKGYTGTAVS